MITVRKGTKAFDGKVKTADLDQQSLLLAHKLIKKVNHLFLICSNTQ